ncbi:MAG: indole-3-glycerol phosphate synthase TrpC [Gammaproteobacteria bacterium]|nr:MAG: indole-3-glycerol phosphate synthase TrpC [Gammaproteobacteria bacterium]
MSNILEKIVATKKIEIKKAQQKINLDELKNLIAKNQPPTPRGFIDAISLKYQQKKPAIIAEIKKASPSRGIICHNFNPAKIAKMYQQGGACCLSVLTDKKYFKGSTKYLKKAKNSCDLPVLRKDFIIDEYQIYQSKLMGADCILLIAAILSLAELNELIAVAHNLQLDVLLEVHNQKEMMMANQTKARLLGVNNRNLKDFSIDIENTKKLKEFANQDKIIITESGINNKDTVRQMLQNNIYGFLIGEAFIKEHAPLLKMQQMFA